MAFSRGKHQRSLLGGIASYSLRFVAGGNEEGDDGHTAGECSEVQRGVGEVGEVWVLGKGGV